MNLLAFLPPFRDWSPSDVLASPAWSLPCRLGPEEGRLVTEGARLPVDPLRLDIRFADAPATLALADSPIFPELHALWPSRADVPEPLLLALVERECGPLLQILENAAGRQLAVDGLADADEHAASGVRRPGSGEARPFALLRASGEALCSFALTLPSAVLESFGALRNLDAAHPSVREIELPAVEQIAAPVLSAADLESIVPGDHLLLPEVEAAAEAPGEREPPGRRSCPGATLIVSGILAAAPAGVAPWTDSGALRVILSEPATVLLGELLDLSSGALDHASLVARHSSLREGAALALVRGSETLAAGRLASIAGQPSFAVESTP